MGQLVSSVSAAGPNGENGVGNSVVGASREKQRAGEDDCQRRVTLGRGDPRDVPGPSSSRARAEGSQKNTKGTSVWRLDMLYDSNKRKTKSEELKDQEVPRIPVGEGAMKKVFKKVKSIPQENAYKAQDENGNIVANATENLSEAGNQLTVIRKISNENREKPTRDVNIRTAGERKQFQGVNYTNNTSGTLLLKYDEVKPSTSSQDDYNFGISKDLASNISASSRNKGLSRSHSDMTSFNTNRLQDNLPRADRLYAGIGAQGFENIRTASALRQAINEAASVLKSSEALLVERMPNTKGVFGNRFLDPVSPGQYFPEFKLPTDQPSYNLEEVDRMSRTESWVNSNGGFKKAPVLPQLAVDDTSNSELASGANSMSVSAPYTAKAGSSKSQYSQALFNEAYRKWERDSHLTPGLPPVPQRSMELKTPSTLIRNVVSASTSTPRLLSPINDPCTSMELDTPSTSHVGQRDNIKGTEAWGDKRSTEMMYECQDEEQFRYDMELAHRLSLQENWRVFNHEQRASPEKKAENAEIMNVSDDDEEKFRMSLEKARQLSLSELLRRQQSTKKRTDGPSSATKSDETTLKGTGMDMEVDSDTGEGPFPGAARRMIRDVIVPEMKAVGPMSKSLSEEEKFLKDMELARQLSMEEALRRRRQGDDFQ